MLLAVIGFAIGGAVGGWSLLQSTNTENQDDGGGHEIVSAKIGGTFSLVDQDGVARTEKDYAGKYKLIYFGFTYCPAICPTELSKMAEAYLSLPSDIQQNIQPIFISVDPDRDTPAVMKGYVGLFMPQLVGLTGTPAQVEAVKKDFKVYAVKVPEGSGSDEYTVDHSSMMYYLTPDGQTVAMFKTGDSVEKIAERIKGSLQLE
ncbi:MAG TPA: SCO family protein [Alphaproteobacteria bacterium]|nr:SCO family protein [Alphaproteobacteria bacterium]